jgi:hypothetical protein
MRHSGLATRRVGKCDLRRVGKCDLRRVGKCDLRRVGECDLRRVGKCDLRGVGLHDPISWRPTLCPGLQADSGALSLEMLMLLGGVARKQLRARGAVITELAGESRSVYQMWVSVRSIWPRFEFGKIQQGQ